MLPDPAVLDASATACIICAIGASKYHAIIAVASNDIGYSLPTRHYAIRPSYHIAFLLKHWQWRYVTMFEFIKGSRRVFASSFRNSDYGKSNRQITFLSVNNPNF